MSQYMSCASTDHNYNQHDLLAHTWSISLPKNLIRTPSSKILSNHVESPHHRGPQDEPNIVLFGNETHHHSHWENIQLGSDMYRTYYRVYIGRSVFWSRILQTHYLFRNTAHIQTGNLFCAPLCKTPLSFVRFLPNSHFWYSKRAV